MRPSNPFFTTNPIPDEYFCDRKDDTESLVREIESGNHILLMSPRRMGKTGLINHLFEDDRIKGHFNTFFIDIYDTSTISELTFRLGKEVFDRMSLWGKAKATGFLGVLRSLRGELSYDSVTQLPRFAFSVGQIKNPEMTLDEIFAYLEGLDRPCIVAIDEFQQISWYEENNVEAMLRTRMQRLGNVRFIFSGSEPHLLSQMFATKARPFYRSGSTIVLERIPEPVYRDFATGLFKLYGKTISDDAVTSLYQMVDGYTYFLQKTLSYAFSRVSEAGAVYKDELLLLMEGLLESESHNFKNILSLLTANQRQLLSAIALCGKAENILSYDFVTRYHLGVPSSVQSAARSLLKKQMISRSGDVYIIDDKFLELWLRRSAGVPLEGCFNNLAK